MHSPFAAPLSSWFAALIRRKTTPIDPAGDAGEWTLFESLQQVLRLAESYPSGPVGDDIRRAACELIEADSAPTQSACRRRILSSIASAASRHAKGRSHVTDPSLPALNELSAALTRGLRG